MAKATSDKGKKVFKKSAAKASRATTKVAPPARAVKKSAAAPIQKAALKSGADKAAAVKNEGAKAPRKSAVARGVSEKSGVKKGAVKSTKKKTVVARPPEVKSTKKATPIAVAPKAVAKKTSAPKAAAPSAKKGNAKPAAPSAKAPSAKVQSAKAPNAPKAAPAGEKGALSVGAKAPSFSLADQSGQTISSASLAGKPYVLYFYPKDNTPGCTQEACDFRDGIGAFEKVGVPVFGVSPDSVKSHAGFAQKFSLPFSLLADVDKQLVNAYGVWALKQNYGREYWGVVRSTFLIDRAGKVAQVWSPVRVKDHAESVRQAAAAL